MADFDFSSKNFVLWEKTPGFPQYDGVFILNKPAGPSSAKCLSLFKKMGQKKIGHAGTLDPFASGVLIVLLGQATKLASYFLQDNKKIYSGTIRLGVETDTWDNTGKIIATAEPGVDIAELEKEISFWRECREQIVPPFSAAKFQGKPFYDLARKGLECPVRYKEIKVYKGELLNYNPPFVDFRVVCGSGTYIRSLAHSLGKRLGCGAVLTRLTREYCYPFGLRHACAPEALARDPSLLQKKIVPVHLAFPDLKKVEIMESQVDLVKNGMPIPAVDSDWNEAEECLLLFDKKAIAIGVLKKIVKGSFWQIKRGLWKN